MRFFYGVTFEKETQSFFDLLNLIADPFKKKRSSAHITLRGPYAAEKNFEWLAKFVTHKAKIKAIEKFDTRKGVALVLIIDIENLDKLWDKPDYPNGKPHLTICETSDIEFVNHLFDLFSSSSILDLEFSTTPLKQINTKRLAQDFENYEEMMTLFESHIPGHDWCRLEDLMKTPATKRLKFIEHLLKGGLSDVQCTI